MLPQGVYEASYRDFSSSLDGASAYGDISIPKLGSLSYEGYGGYVSLSEKGGIARALQDSLRNPPTQYQDVNGFPSAGGQLWWNTPGAGTARGSRICV